MSTVIHPVANSRAAYPRSGKDGDKQNPSITIFSNTHIHYGDAPPPAHIAPALISIADLGVLLNARVDRRRLPSEIPYADHSLSPPHYIDDFIDLLPPAMLEPTGGMVDRRV